MCNDVYKRQTIAKALLGNKRNRVLRKHIIYAAYPHSAKTCLSSLDVLQKMLHEGTAHYYTAT